MCDPVYPFGAHQKKQSPSGKAPLPLVRVGSIVAKYGGNLPMSSLQHTLRGMVMVICSSLFNIL